MRIGFSLLLIAVGAILRFAVQTQHSHGVAVGTVGVILMIVGLVGLLLTLGWMTTRRRTDVTYRRDGVTYTEPGPAEPLDPRY